MKKLSFVFVLLLVVLFAVVKAKCQPIGSIPLTGMQLTIPNVGTVSFDYIKFDDNTISILDVTSPYDAGVGTTYIDFGHGLSTAFVTGNTYTIDPYLSDHTIFGSWAVEAAIEDVQSNPLGITYNIGYTNGSIDAYLGPKDDYNFGSTSSPSDDYVDTSSSVLLLQAEILPEYSFGTVVRDVNTEQLFRSVSAVFQVTSISPLFSHPSIPNLRPQDLLLLVTESATSGASAWTTAWIDGENNAAVTSAGTATIQFYYHPVPEPATIILTGLGLGIIGTALRARRERKCVTN